MNLSFYQHEFAGVLKRIHAVYIMLPSQTE